MKTKTFKLKVGWNTEYFPGDVETIVLELDQEDILNIQKHQRYIKDHDDIFKVVTHTHANFLDENNEETDFVTDGPYLSIFKDVVYVFAQSKYDAGTQIESEALDIETIINTNFDES